MRVCEPKFGFVKVQISVLPEPAEVYYHVNPIFDLPSYLPLTLKTFSTSHTLTRAVSQFLRCFLKKGSSKLSLGLSYKSRAVSQFMRCLLDYNFFPSLQTTLNVTPEFQKRADRGDQSVLIFSGRC